MSKLNIGEFKAVESWGENRYLAPVFADEDPFEFKLDNKYFQISKPEKSQFNKLQIIFKSKELNAEVEKIKSALEKESGLAIISPVQPDGFIRTPINTSTNVYNVNKEPIEFPLIANKLDVFVVFSVPSIFKDANKKINTMQLHLKSVYIIKEHTDIDDVDFSKLTLAN